LVFALNVFATKAKEINGTIKLQNPLIIYKDYFIQAKEGVIKSKKEAVLKKDVVIFYDSQAIKADEVVIKSKNDIFIQNPFIYDNNMGVWFKNKSTSIKNEIIKLNKTIFSSCCIDKPDWYLYIDKGEFNKKSKYMRLYNIVLYVDEKPVFYFPFYFNSLDKRRRSGLLRPMVGISGKEGILYSQPVYFVINQRADFEITPTIRTLRGVGVYNTFRFVDSPYSYGELRFGEFVDKKKYYLSNNLANIKHFGYSFYYLRNKVFNDDKLYLDIKYANDVDYFYLDAYNYTFNTTYLVDKIITSKLNYIKPLDDSIFGLYAKYFIDTSKISNADTVQILPQINYHVYEKKDKFLTYFDTNYYNYTSEIKQYYNIDASFGIGKNFLLFDDYLNLKLSQNFFFINGNYYQRDDSQYFLQSYSSIKLSSSLARKNHSLHILNPSITLNLNTVSKSTDKTDLLEYSKIKDSINFSLFQIYDGFVYFDHTLTQNVNLNFESLGNLENILNIKKNNISIYETNRFDWSQKRSVYNNFGLGFRVGDWKINLSHIYQYSDVKLKSYTLRSEKFFGKKSYYFEYNYDMIDKYTKYILAGVKLKKRCFKYDLSIKKSRVPVLKESGISYNNDYLLKLNIYFYPIGGLKQAIQIN